MPRYGGRAKGTPNKKTVWILESLAEHGYDYEAMLTKFLGKAAQGDRHALDMAHLLIKLVPYLANAPKNDAGTMQIETLVINRFDSPSKLDSAHDAGLVNRSDAVETETIPNTDGQDLTTP